MVKKVSLILGVLFLTSCATTTSRSAPTVPLAQASSSAPSVTPPVSLSPSPTPTSATINLSTPTPILYSVVLNDTLIGIARKFQLELQDLVSANPDVASQALTVGTVLVIPSAHQSNGTSTPTPVPLTIQQVECFSNMDDSLYCLALLKNDTSTAIHALSAVFILQDQTGASIAEITAYPPLDIIPVGVSIPLGILFPPQSGQQLQPRLQLLTANAISSPSTQYPPAVISSSLVQISWNGLTATISGDAALLSSDQKASRVWVLALAFNSDGKLVGFSRWESGTPLQGTQTIPFQFQVSSLKGVITTVELLIETAQ